MPVEIQLTNSSEGMPYIKSCWEVEEGKGQRFSRNLLHFSVITPGEIMKSSCYLLVCFLAIEKYCVTE